MYCVHLWLRHQHRHESDTVSWHRNYHACMLCLRLAGSTVRSDLPCAGSMHSALLQVDKDLREMLLTQNAPQPKVVGVRCWPRAIPQFNVGHLDQLEVGIDKT